MAKKRSPHSPESYEVGYGRPPKASRWRAGQSGNPSGKKKGTRNERTVLNQLMKQKIQIIRRGIPRQISTYEGLYCSLFAPGLRGNFKAATYLIDKYEAFEAKQAARDANRVVTRLTEGMTDQEAIDAYALAIKNPDPEIED